MEIIDRLKSKTPPFWVKMRNTMIAIGLVSGVVLTAPVSLPASLITLAGYGVAIGSVGATLSQLTKEDSSDT
jgi:hypothetical protein